MLAIEDIAARHDLKLASVCHAADGNLHPNFLYDPDKDPGVIDRIHKASEEVMQICIHLGGVLSGEHGIGLEKRDFMPFMFTQEEMDLMVKVRKVFDPEMRNNPDKIFPIRVCKEC
jgi:glycolate oxidase